MTVASLFVGWFIEKDIIYFVYLLIFDNSCKNLNLINVIDRYIVGQIDSLIDR